MNARGFALLEWLVASALVVIIAGALFTAVAPVRDFVERSHQTAEQVPGARAALDLLVAELREAGGGIAVAPPNVALTDRVAPVRLLQDVDGDIDVQPANAMRVVRVPPLAAQARLRLPAFAGETLLRLETAARCAAGAGCGFRMGDRAVLLTADAAEHVAIQLVSVDEVMLESPLINGFPSGAVLCRLVTTAYGLRPGASGADRLVRVTDGGAEQPLLDNVVAFEITADALDPLDITRVSLRLRVEAGAAQFRGPAGPLFVRPGTATSARRWLPDAELRAVVALRGAGMPL